MKIIETMEINELHKEGGTRYRITAQDLKDGDFAATITIRAPMVITDQGPYLPGSVALALLNVVEGLRMEVVDEDRDQAVPGDG